MTDSRASSHEALSSRRTAKEERRPELEGGRVRVCESGHAALHTTTHPVPRHLQYSHRAFLLEALPLGGAGGSGGQDVQEDTHLGSGKGRERAREQRQFPPCPGGAGSLTETAKATGPAKLQISVS